MKLDFAIVGQPKSGTTALAQFLSEHPQICFSLPKEPDYFATDLIRESDDFHGKKKFFPIRSAKQYSRCFAHSTPSQKLGEATTLYMFSKEAAKNIYTHNPSAKIIIMLRNPVDFMHSMHMQSVNANGEDELDFEKALALEPARRRGEHIPSGVRFPSRLFYREFAEYSAQLKRFQDIFPSDNILILTNEEFKKDNAATFKRVLKFLEVDPTFAPEFKIVHGSKTVRYKRLNKIIQAGWLQTTMHTLLPPAAYEKIGSIVHAITRKEQPRVEMPIELRRKLKDDCRAEVRKLSSLTGRDLATEWGFEAE